MGATTFVISYKGETLGEAYNNAVTDALWNHGHDPYNGTISTTDGVTDRTERLKYFKGDVDSWANEAFKFTEKWDSCWGAYTGHSIVRGTHGEQLENDYIFAGWAAE